MIREPMRCQWCGEILLLDSAGLPCHEGDSLAELGLPGEKVDEHILVHSEPCATEAMHKGWELA